ncbi:MAG: tetratricopeptide repeat protein [Acetobacteraceae bacterium]
MRSEERTRQLAAAVQYLQTGRWSYAEAESRALVATDPSDLDALLILGLAIAASGEASRAAPVLDRLWRARPEYRHPCQDLADLRPPLPTALISRQYRASLRLAPGDGRLRRQFAAFLLDHQLPAEAATVLQDGLGTADGHALMGLALAETGDFADAIAQFRRVVELDPESLLGWANLGLVLKVEGRFAESIDAYDRAIALNPGDARIRVNRAVALLRAGRWTEAWTDYEWRLRLPGQLPLPASALLPALETIEDLRGVTILATHEDGFGDTLQFMRYLPLLAERGARVLALVPAPLVRLVRRLPGVSVLPAGSPLPDYDFHCPMFSLPRAFGTTIATIPGAPYLDVDPDDAAAWAGRLPSDGLRVGLAWAGQARPWVSGFSTLDRRRSARLAAFAPLAALAGVRLVSLQVGPAARQLEPPPLDMAIHDAVAEVHDFADTAAIIANLDVVVSVDTSIVHLTGAMGKPVFLLDRYDNCWRWLSGRSDSPWYPGLTIFRQDRIHDWSGPMQRVAAALAAMAAFKGGPAADGRPSRSPALADAA